MDITGKRIPVSQTEHNEQRTIVGTGTGQQMRLFFILIIAAFVVTALVGGALSWDGSYFLFSALDTGAPFAPHGRWINAIAQYPTLWLSRVTSDTNLLMATFGLAYALFPICSLISAWLIVRDESPELFIWIALGATFGLVVGQFSLTTEALIAVHLTWPLAAVVMVPARRSHIPAIIIFSLLLIFSHPTAIALFVMLAVMAFVIGARFVAQRRSKWSLAAVFSLLCGIVLVRFLLTRTAYENEQLSVARLEQAYATSLAGVATLALGLVMIAGLALFIAPLVGERRFLRFGLYGIELVCLLGATTLLILRAALPQLWTGTLDLRTWALFISVPFFGALLLERMISTTRTRARHTREWPHRSNSLLLVGISFFAIMATQSVIWQQMTTTLTRELVQSRFNCVSITSLPWIERTPLNHWSTTTYSLLLQGRAPERVIQGWETCTTSDFTSGVAIAPWEQPDAHGNGWFALDTVQTRVLADRQPIDSCQFSVAEGWFWTERRGASRWHWMGPEATLLITSNDARQVVLRGNLLAVGQDNTLRIAAGAASDLTIAASAKRAMGFEQTLQLQPGENVVTLRSQRPPVQSGSDTRPLTFGFENLAVSSIGQARACLLRP